MIDSDEPASATVVRRIAEREGEAVADLDPLYDAIEPEALDRLCEHGFDGQLAFSYQGYRIVVSGDGTISIAD